MKGLRFVTWTALVVLGASAQAAGEAKNHFGSIYIDGKKAGQVHYTVEYGEAGDIETLKTRASLSILGVKVFNFEHNLHEEWLRGDLRNMRGRTDDDGKIYEASLERASATYKGALNGTPIELPGNAFPASVWHYVIVDRSLLFDLKTLKLMRVKVARSNETLTIQKKTIPADRFDFSGEWQASVWFDRKRQLVQFKYMVDGHEVTVQLDE
jgi:hypothetical protein